MISARSTNTMRSSFRLPGKPQPGHYRRSSDRLSRSQECRGLCCWLQLVTIMISVTANTATHRLFLDFMSIRMSHFTAKRKSVQSYLKSNRSQQRLSASSTSRRSSSGSASIMLLTCSVKVDDERSDAILQRSVE